jgi:hypothetical protein
LPLKIAAALNGAEDLNPLRFDQADDSIILENQLAHTGPGAGSRHAPT